MKFPSWLPMIEGMMEGVWIVDAIELRILAVNRTGAAMLDIPQKLLINKPVIELAATPEDICFWEDVATGQADHILSETLLARADGSTLHVERKVSRIILTDATSIFVVGIRDQSEERRVEGELEKLVAELRATLESTADGILVTDLEGAIRSHNQRFAELWGLPTDLMTQRDDAGIYAWMARDVVDAATYAARLTAISRTPLLETSDVLILRSGSVLERVTLPQYSRGRPIGRVYSFRDISQRLADEARLQLAAKVFEASLDAIFITAPDFRIVAANPACQRLLGQTIAQLQSQTAHDILTDALTQSHFAEHVESHLAERGYWEGEAWHRRADGSCFPCQASVVRVADDPDSPRHYIGFFKDLSETVSARKRIEVLAYTDALTGLPNRLMLAERIDFAINLANRDESTFALLFIDLDRFKHINDSLGHMFGDRVLIEIAERIKACLRQVDTAARLGGDEFLILLHKTDARGAEISAQRILDRLSQPIHIDELSFTVTCSIGITLYPDDGPTMDDLVKNADAAMYHVKERGRAGFRFYQRQMNIGLLSRMKLDHAMRQALKHPNTEHGFRLHYQPQINLHDNVIFGAEALLRWRDADMGDIPPGRFIPVAEETGLIVGLGNWVLEESVRQCALWNAKGLSMTVAINVSALQFHQPDFSTIVAHALQTYQLPPRQLELELTESILIHDLEETLKRLHVLASLGVTLAIDDFGTGYSSLSYLKRFPIHKLKIDRSFITDIPGDDSNEAIVNAIIQLAGALHLKVIAEGVETETQRDFLIASECDEFQGFLCSPALPAVAFEELVIGRGIADATTARHFTTRKVDAGDTAS